MMASYKPSILDVARYAGVSQGTVSRVLSDSGYIKAETREKVLQAVKELNYIPNRAGRALKTTRTGLIMLAIPDIGHNIYAGMIEGVNKSARKHNYSVVLFFTDGTLRGEMNAVRMVQEHLVDGLFLVHFSYDATLRAAIDSCEAPVVLCGMCRSRWAGEAGKSFSTLSIDVYSGIYKMTCEMIKSGHRHIAYLAGIQGNECYAQRYKAYLDAMRDFGLKVNPEDSFWHDYSKQHGYNTAQALAKRGMEKFPDCMVASNDLQALGFWQGCQDCGISVPGDIALSGMDNLDEMKMLRLSSIIMMENQVGETGADIILEQLQDDKDRFNCRDLNYEPQIVVRDSV